METLQSEVHGHVTDEVNVYEQNLKCLSDENGPLGAKVVQVTKYVRMKSFYSIENFSSI